MRELQQVRTPGGEQGTEQLLMLGESFRRSLLAQNKAKGTVTAYMRPVLSFIAFAGERRGPRLRNQPS